MADLSSCPAAARAVSCDVLPGGALSAGAVPDVDGADEAGGTAVGFMVCAPAPA